jgi:uncharacterized damage-inducible protein DinB
MRTPLEQLAHHAETLFQGQPWYGESLMHCLEGISPAEARAQIAGRSILRLTRHLLAWRIFTLKKMQGEADYDIEIGSPIDWPSDDEPGAPTWPELLRDLRENQSRLLAAIRSMPESQLLERVPGRTYRFAFLIQGIQEHDVYHLGQVNLLRSLLKEM